MYDYRSEIKIPHYIKKHHIVLSSCLLFITYRKILFNNNNEYKNYCSKIIFFLTKELDYTLKHFIENQNEKDEKSHDMSFFINVVLDIVNISIYYIYYSNPITDLLNYKFNNNNPKFIRDYSFFKDLIDTLLILYPNIVIQTFTICECANINENVIKSDITSNNTNNDNSEIDDSKKTSKSVDNENFNDNFNYKNDQKLTNIEKDHNIIENNDINNSDNKNKQFINLLVHFYYQNTSGENDSNINKKKRKEIIFKIKYIFIWQSIYNLNQTKDEINKFYNDLKLFYLFCFIFNSDMFSQVLSLNHQKYDKKTTKLFIDKLVLNYFYLIKNYSYYQDIVVSENNISNISLFDSSPINDINSFQLNIISFNELFNGIEEVYDNRKFHYKLLPLINIPEKSIINITNMLIKWMEYFEQKNKVNEKRNENKNEGENSEVIINSEFNNELTDNNKNALNSNSNVTDTNINIKEIKQLLKPYKINLDIFKIYTSNNIDFIKRLVFWNNNNHHHNMENKNTTSQLDKNNGKKPDEKIINDSFYNINITNLKSGLMK